MFLLQCFSPGCLESRGALPEEERLTRNFCAHIAKAKEALSQKQFAPSDSVNIQTVLEKVHDESLERSFTNESSDGEINLYFLPGANIAVPVLDIHAAGNLPEFVHVRDLQCSLDICSRKSKKHTILEKGVPLCAHRILLNFLPKVDKGLKQKKETKHLIDAQLTVKTLIAKIRQNFPPSFESLIKRDFLTKSRSFVDSILSSEEKLKEVLENIPPNCELCNGLLEVWKHKEPKSFLLALGHMKKVQILVKICPACKLAVYPDLLQMGLIFAHNKFIITIEAILDMLNTLKINGSLIHSIEEKLKLLGRLEGIASDVIETDITNNSLKLEKIVISVSSILGKIMEGKKVSVLKGAREMKLGMDFLFIFLFII